MAEQKPARLTSIDGARGYLLLMMFLAHFSFTHWTPLYYLHHGNYSPVFDGEFFVLLSGFVCALSYQRAFAVGGAWNCEKAVLRRLRWVYLYQITIAIIMVLFTVSILPMRLGETSLKTLEAPLYIQIASTLTFARMPQYLDILILYMSLMLFIPLALTLLSQKRIFLYFLILLGAWLISRFQVDVALTRIIVEQTIDTSPYFQTRGSFNPFSYALVFYAGFYLGYRYKTDGDVQFRRSVLPLRGWLFAIAALIVIAFIVAEGFRMSLGTPSWIYDPKRYEITLTGLVGLTAIAYTLYYLLSENNLSVPFSWISKALRAILSFRIFVLIGQNSLFFYSLHVLGVFGSSYVIQVLGFTESKLHIVVLFLVTTSFMVILTAAKNRFLPFLP